MALNRRERTLAFGAGALVAIALVQFGYASVQSLFDDRQTRIDALAREVADKNTAILRGKKAQKRLAEWQHRSLPTDLVLARSLYVNWLVRLLERTRLAKADVTLGANLPKPGIYTKIPVTVRGQGTMDQVVQFLYEFYRANYLHSIRQLTLTPLAANVAPAAGPAGAMPTNATPGSPAPPTGGGPPKSPPGGPDVGARGRFGGRGGFAGRPGGLGPGAFGPRAFGSGGPRTEGQKFELVLGIEAMSLPGGDHSDQLNEGQADRLAFSDMETYRKTITERNFFSPYTPVVESDPAGDTFVTAVVKKEGVSYVWINVRSSGKTLKLKEGDTFDLGKEKATIARISPPTVEIDVGERRRVVTLGKSLAEQRGRRGGRGMRGGFPPEMDFPGP